MLTKKKTDKFSKKQQELLNHPLLSRYCPSERRAIVCHHLYLIYQSQAEVALWETVKSWDEGACIPWRREKMRLDCKEQLRHIEEYRLRLSGRSKKEVKPETAACRWIQKYAASWRENWENQAESTPLIFPYFFFNFFQQAS